MQSCVCSSHRQSLASRGNGADDPGAILEGRYGVTNDTVFIEDDRATRLQRKGSVLTRKRLAWRKSSLREKWRNRHPNAPAGFYDGPINRPTTTFH